MVIVFTPWLRAGFCCLSCQILEERLVWYLAATVLVRHLWLFLVRQMGHEPQPVTCYSPYSNLEDPKFFFGIV